MSRRAAPGQPWAKVEKSRRTTWLAYARRYPNITPKRPERGTLLRELHIDDAAFQADHGRVGAVFRPQFGQDVSDLAFDRLLADG